MIAKLDDKGKKLIIEVDVDEYESLKGNMVIATSRGNQPMPLTYKGKSVVCNIGVNAYIKK